MAEERTLPRFKNDNDEKSVVVEKVFLLAIEGPLEGSVITLMEGTQSLGRDSKANIVLADTQASREHAQFKCEHGKTIVKDLGSTNGTFVNGQKILKPTELSEGDEVLIGQTLFRFTFINPVGAGKIGLATHGYFENRLSEELDRALRYKRPLSMMMMKFDVLSSLTPNLEHKLQKEYPKVVSLVRSMIRTMDILGHYGKNELELLLPETDKVECEKLAERILNEKKWDDALGLFIGLATFPEDGRSRDVLIEKSRVALQEARKNPSTRIQKSKEEFVRKNSANQTIIVQNEKMKQVFEMIEKVSKSSITVLVLGETGVGKEVIAEAIHAGSERAKKDLVCVNCAALTETLLESELFGHEKGSFTGADNTKVGLFESANGGTIFLDEVGEMPLKTQAKLLRVLQSKKIMRVGSNRELDSDVRVVAATNRRLEELVEKKLFREDLFYRLNAVTISIPPLRERKDEIPHLVENFISKVCHDNALDIKQITPQAMFQLSQYEWPGNIRELKNAIERAVVISDGSVIDVDSLSGKLSMTLKPGTMPSDAMVQMDTRVGDMKDVVGDYERNIIVQALNQTNWNQTKAAELLHVPRRTLVSKIKKYGIQRT